MIATTEKNTVRETDACWESFQQLLKDQCANDPAWLLSARKAGISTFTELGYPTTADEDWRFTNVTPVTQLPFKPSLGAANAITAKTLEGKAFMGQATIKLVFVDGHYQPALSKLAPLPAGVVVQNLAEAIRSGHPSVQAHLAHYLRGESNAFAALNTAFFRDGLFVHVPDNVTVETPIHLLHYTSSTEAGAVAHLRNLIHVGKNAKATVIESFHGAEGGRYLTNQATEIVADQDAFVEHIKFQDEPETAYHLGSFHANIGKGAKVYAHSIALGAAISRNSIRTLFSGPRVDCILNGLYATRGQQIADHYMVVEHAQPHCNSHEYFNGILADKSRGVFHGRILVRPIAQKTDAKQTNKNLLLSDDATANSKPQLEIYADDVKCTHGATIGQLNDESIFYLRARGISLDKARRMLMKAFAGEIIERVQNFALREELDAIIWEHLEAFDQIAVH